MLFVVVLRSIRVLVVVLLRGVVLVLVCVVVSCLVLRRFVGGVYEACFV